MGYLVSLNISFLGNLFSGVDRIPSWCRHRIHFVYQSDLSSIDRCLTFSVHVHALRCAWICKNLPCTQFLCLYICEVCVRLIGCCDVMIIMFYVWKICQIESIVTVVYIPKTFNWVLCTAKAKKIGSSKIENLCTPIDLRQAFLRRLDVHRPCVLTVFTAFVCLCLCATIRCQWASISSLC